MILSFPSGFYRTVLPPAPESRGNITYTISNESPPRGALFFLKINNALAVNSPPLVATIPQGTLNSGTLRAFRSNGTIDIEPRPIGSILEFTDQYRTLDVQQDSLDETVNFPRFNNVSTDPVNTKLLDAYTQFQRQLLTASQQSASKQIEIENIERLTNAAVASLQATQEALKILIGDVDLLAAEADLLQKIDANTQQIAVLRQEIVSLDAERSKAADSVRRLSKVIS